MLFTPFLLLAGDGPEYAAVTSGSAGPVVYCDSIWTGALSS